MKMRYMLLSTIAMVASPAAVYAQAAPTAPAEPAAAPAAAEPAAAEIVVTGRAGGNGIRKLEAGYSITTISSADIAIQNPKSTGDLLKSVPGVWVESSGGVGTSNVFVRGIPDTGDAPFVTMQFNSVPVFGVNSPSFMDQTALVRVDETIQGVEAVNGGPASLFSDGQPGLTTNLILREGHEETAGDIKLSSTNYGARRVDGYVSGKLAEDTYYMVGGYYQAGDSVREAGFDTEKGGQITLNLTHKFDIGKLEVFGRYTDDHGEWFTPFATSVPGLNLGTYNQMNNYTRNLTIAVPGSGNSGATEQFDLGKGRGWKGFIGGGNLNLDLGSNLTFADHFGFTNGTLQTTGLVAQGAGAITVAQALTAGDGTAGQTVVSGIHTGQALASSDYVQQYGAWVIEKKLNSISNEAAFTLNVANNKITAGYYFNHFSSNDLWSLGNNYWMQVGGSADVVNLDNSNATSGGYNIADYGSADENALYLADSFQITPLLRLDAGVRWEREVIHFALNDIGTTLTNGSSGALNIARHAVPWSAGLDYKVAPDFNVYARASKGYHIPSFDDVRSQIGNSGPATDDNWQIWSYEVGAKFHHHGLDASLEGFFDKVKGLVDNDVGVPVELVGSRTWGLEFAGSWTSDFGLSLSTDAVLENPKTEYAVDPSINGNQAPRIPKYQLRFTPAYKVSRGDTSATLYGTFEALGKRYSDLNNYQTLPAYQTLAAGILVEHNGLSFQAAADNLTNSHGLTEGNPRSLGVDQGFADSRPIFGRSYRFTVGYKF